MMFPMVGQKMKAAFTTMLPAKRVNGHVSIWQRCPLPFGNADSEF
jgi:hypothetical protein